MSDTYPGPETIVVVKMLIEKVGNPSLIQKVTYDKLDMFIQYIKYKARKHDRYLDEVNFWL